MILWRHPEGGLYRILHVVELPNEGGEGIMFQGVGTANDGMAKVLPTDAFTQRYKREVLTTRQEAWEKGHTWLMFALLGAIVAGVIALLLIAVAAAGIGWKHVGLQGWVIFASALAVAIGGWNRGKRIASRYDVDA